MKQFFTDPNFYILRFAGSYTRLLQFAIAFIVIMSPASYGVIVLTPADYLTVRRQDVGAYYFDGTIPSIRVGVNSSPRFFRHVAEFDISSFRNDILNASSITLNYTVDLVLGPLGFDGVDLVHLDSSAADGMVTGSVGGARNTDGSDYSADGVTVVEGFDVSGVEAGDVFSFDITDSLKADAANLAIVYSAYRMQMTDGIDFGNEQGIAYGQFIRFAILGEENEAYIEITPDSIPEPGMTSLIVICAAFGVCVFKRNLKNRRP